MVSRLKYLAAITPLLASVGITDALAQDSGSASQKQPAFEELIVTAQKREQSPYEVPVALSVFSAASVEKQGIKDLIDVGKFVPNLNVTSFGGGQVSSANPFIRGIGLQDHLITTDPGVGVYVDGVYLGRQVGQNWSLANIERIEVLRGPQGTLYGRNSIGGAINILTRKPGEENESRLSVQAGTRGRLDGQFYSSYRISDQVAVSGSIGYTSRDGVGEFTNLNTSTEVGETEDVSGRLSVLFTPSEDLSILLAADASDADSGLGPYRTFIDELPDGGAFQAGLRNSQMAANPYDNATGDAEVADTGNSASGVSVTVDYAISEILDLKVVASTRTSDYKTGLDDDSTETLFHSFPEIGEADQDSFEIQLNATYDNFDFVTGVYYFTEDGFNEQPRNFFQAGQGSIRLNQQVDSKAVYFNAGYNVSDVFRVAAGVRYTEDTKDADVDISNFVQTAGSDRFTETSWDLSATYELDNGMVAYGSIANGFQSGQFPPRPFCVFGSLDFTQPGNLAPQNCFNADLNNITALNYEVGIKGQLTDDFQMSVAVFNTEYEDLPIQVSNLTDAGFNTENLIVDQTSKGLEWESSWRIGDGFYLRTSLGYIDTDIDSANPFAVAPLTPELTASISPEYSFGVASGGSVTLRADYSYRDDMYGEPSSDPSRLTQIDSRSLLNFDVSYESADEDWTVALYGRNVTDERYDQARLNTGGYILAILSNDASEFGLRFTKEF